jgi:hypothetical protein
MWVGAWGRFPVVKKNSEKLHQVPGTDAWIITITILMILVDVMLQNLWVRIVCLSRPFVVICIAPVTIA